MAPSFSISVNAFFLKVYSSEINVARIAFLQLIAQHGFYHPLLPTFLKPVLYFSFVNITELS